MHYKVISILSLALACQVSAREVQQSSPAIGSHRSITSDKSQIKIDSAVEDFVHNARNILNLHCKECRKKQLEFYKLRDQLPKVSKNKKDKFFITQGDFDAIFKQFEQQNDQAFKEIQKIIDTLGLANKMDHKISDKITEKITLYSSNCNRVPRDTLAQIKKQSGQKP